MVIKHLLKSVGIAIISALIYSIYVSDREIDSEESQKNSLKTFTIVMIVSFSILFIFSGGSQELTPISRSGGGSPTLNAKPPF